VGEARCWFGAPGYLQLKLDSNLANEPVRVGTTRGGEPKRKMGT
jgi:hypothetical protein